MNKTKFLQENYERNKYISIEKDNTDSIIKFDKKKYWEDVYCFECTIKKDCLNDCPKNNEMAKRVEFINKANEFIKLKNKYKDYEEYYEEFIRGNINIQKEEFINYVMINDKFSQDIIVKNDETIKKIEDKIITDLETLYNNLKKKYEPLEKLMIDVNEIKEYIKLEILNLNLADEFKKNIKNYVYSQEFDEVLKMKNDLQNNGNGNDTYFIKQKINLILEIIEKGMDTRAIKLYLEDAIRNNYYLGSHINFSDGCGKTINGEYYNTFSELFRRINY